MSFEQAEEVLSLFRDIQHNVVVVQTLLHRQMIFTVVSGAMIMALQAWLIILAFRARWQVRILGDRLKEYEDRVERLELLTEYEEER